MASRPTSSSGSSTTSACWVPAESSASRTAGTGTSPSIPTGARPSTRRARTPSRKFAKRPGPRPRPRSASSLKAAARLSRGKSSPATSAIAPRRLRWRRDWRCSRATALARTTTARWSGPCPRRSAGCCPTKSLPELRLGAAERRGSDHPEGGGGRRYRLLLRDVTLGDHLLQDRGSPSRREVRVYQRVVEGRRLLDAGEERVVRQTKNSEPPWQRQPWPAS